MDKATNKQFIPFNRLSLVGNELKYIESALLSGHVSANGEFTRRCENRMEELFAVHKVMLTTSCTHAIEMMALLLDIRSGDEIIAPSFAYVSTVNPFVLRGAKIIFVDSQEGSPNMDASKVEALVTSKTKAIICVHYGGIACDMESLLEIGKKYQIPILEDAAHSIGSRSKDGRSLGTIGTMGAISFHETKNISCGEGGALFINEPTLVKQSQIIREKGTDRSAFMRGETKLYQWVGIGSSYMPSEVSAAFLLGQLEQQEKVIAKRRKLWRHYYECLNKSKMTDHYSLADIVPESEYNGHIFYLLVKNRTQREELIAHLLKQGILSVFHYQSLHKSIFWKEKHDGRSLVNADRFSDVLLRLPLYYEMSCDNVERIVDAISAYTLTFKTS